MITNFKNGNIVLIPDLHKMGKILDVQDLFEDEGIPTVILQTISRDPANGGRKITVLKRKLDKLEPLPEKLMEGAAIEFYQSPIDRVYNSCLDGMQRNRVTFLSTPHPETVESQAQRSAGFYEALQLIASLIEGINGELKPKSCAATWYVARDDDGPVTIFDEHPAPTEMVKGHIWWGKNGIERIPLPQEYMPTLQRGTCRPCRINIELIPMNDDGKADDQ